MAMGKWHSGVFNAIYNRAKTEDNEAGTEEPLKTEPSSKSKWQESILSAIYGESSSSAKEAEAEAPEGGTAATADAKADPVAVAERIFARAEAKRNSVLGRLGSFAGGGQDLFRGNVLPICQLRLFCSHAY